MIRLFSVEYPNYIHANRLNTWWGDPIRWEMAVLVVAAICAVTISRQASRRGASFVAPLICAPLFFGLVSTVFQIHMIFRALAYAGWTGLKGIGPGPEPWDDHIFCALFSTHIGLFSSVSLFLLWLGARAFRLVRTARYPSVQHPTP